MTVASADSERQAFPRPLRGDSFSEREDVGFLAPAFCDSQYAAPQGRSLDARAKLKHAILFHMMSGWFSIHQEGIKA